MVGTQRMTRVTENLQGHQTKREELLVSTAGGLSNQTTFAAIVMFYFL